MVSGAYKGIVVFLRIGPRNLVAAGGMQEEFLLRIVRKRLLADFLHPIRDGHGRKRSIFKCPGSDGRHPVRYRDALKLPTFIANTHRELLDALWELDFLQDTATLERIGADFLHRFRNHDAGQPCTLKAGFLRNHLEAIWKHNFLQRGTVFKGRLSNRPDGRGQGKHLQFRTVQKSIVPDRGHALRDHDLLHRSESMESPTADGRDALLKNHLLGMDLVFRPWISIICIVVLSGRLLDIRLDYQSIRIPVKCKHLLLGGDVLPAALRGICHLRA